jgi:ABC-type Na+ efflux pump permease subunit
MDRTKRILAISLMAFALLLCVPAIAGAQAGQLPVTKTDIVPNNIPGTNDKNGLVKCGNSDGPGNAGANRDCTFTDLINLIQNIFNLVFALAAFVAAGMFMYAGFLMITAMGDTNQITKAKAVFRRVVVGFLILFMSFLLIQQTLKYLSLSPEARKIIERFIDIPNN